MPDLVSDDESQPLLVDQLEHPSADHNDRLVEADCHRCGYGILFDVHLRYGLQVQRRCALAQHLVNARVLPLGDADRGGEVEPPYAALADE